MIKIENFEVVGWEHAIRGMRNPMNSWDKSDSYKTRQTAEFEFFVGENDRDLMKRLVKAGADHRKFMRMIVVYADITAPMYWWKEFDTYKVGTVRNSCSTMHKITEKEFTLDDFSHEHLIVASLNSLKRTIDDLNACRDGYLNEDISNYPEWKKEIWWQLIQLLPSSYNQRSTVMLNYEVLANMYHGRKNHKLDEWNDFCSWVENLPYSELITGGCEPMNVTNYFKKHGFIFGLDMDTNPITVKIFNDMETAVNWSKTGKILCSKSIAVLYSNRTAINQLINSVKTQSAFNNK